MGKQKLIFTKSRGICQETAKAFLLIAEDADGEKVKKAVWLPKSQVKIWERTEEDVTAKLLIKLPSWLLKSNQLDKAPAPRRGTKLVPVWVS